MVIWLVGVLVVMAFWREKPELVLAWLLYSMSIIIYEKQAPSAPSTADVCYPILIQCFFFSEL